MTKKLGLKIGSINNLDLDKDVFFSLSKVADYFEYQSPNPLFFEICDNYKIEPTLLKPHGTKLSLASTETPSKAILKKIKEECKITNSNYLAEHIGYLNPNFYGPPLGYLYAPPLNKKTIQNISENIKILSDYCELPIALENPVQYFQHPDSVLSWSQFIEELSSCLPGSCGWLVDFSHLMVSSMNLENENLDLCLQTYVETKRPIFELHLAGIHEDSSGVMHDSHGDQISEGFLRKTMGFLNAKKVISNNITLEKSLILPENCGVILQELIGVRKILAENLVINTIDLFWENQKDRRFKNKVSLQDRKKAEAKGRAKIVSEIILAQFPSVGEQIFLKISKDLGFIDFGSLLMDFLSDPWADWFDYQKLELSEFNHCLDISFFKYIQNFCLPLEEVYLNEMLVDLSVNCLVKMAMTESVVNHSVYVTLKNNAKTLKKGNYHIFLNTNGDIEAKEIKINKTRHPFFSLDKIQYKGQSI